MKLNLGSGPEVVGGWINIDYALGAKLNKNIIFRNLNKRLHFFNSDWSPEILLHDLTMKFPFNNDSVDIIYSSHTLEHFTKEQGYFILNECYRVLKKDGILRVVVPDLKIIITDYVNNKIHAEDFVYNLGVLSDNKQEKGFIRTILNYYFSLSPHKCMYDHESLIKICNSIGFIANRRNAYDSAINDITLIEKSNRVIDAVIVEACK